MRKVIRNKSETGNKLTAGLEDSWHDFCVAADLRDPRRIWESTGSLLSDDPVHLAVFPTH